MHHSDPEHRIKRLERLLEISRYLGVSQDLESLLQLIVEAICDLTESKAGCILLYEQDTDLLKIVAGPLSDKEALKRIRVPLDRSLAGRVYTQCRPMVVDRSRSDPRLLRDMEHALQIDIASILAVPMIFQGETIGVMKAVNKRDNAHYTEEDVTILVTLASQASVAVLSTLMMEETRRAYLELEELERKKTDFIAIVSHELRTPLGLILGHSTFLRDSAGDEPARQQLDVIVRSATRLKKLIEDLSNANAFYSGKSKLHLKTLAMIELVHKVTATFDEAARLKQINLTVDTRKSGQALFEGDAEKVSLALSHLLENALQFTEKNGHVAVTVEKLPGYVKVSVIDDGVGIPAKDLSRVFEKFYQVESHLTRRHGGLGLGLTVARAMIEMHNGQIWAESVEGKGSSFSFMLPTKGDTTLQSVPAFETDTLSKPFG